MTQLKRRIQSLTAMFICIIAETIRGLALATHSRTALTAENLFLRKQLAFYQERQTRPRRLTDAARFSLSLWSRLFDWRKALVIVKPETLIRWHRKSFGLFWRLKSRAGRPRLPRDIQQLIAEMALNNPTWGQATNEITRPRRHDPSHETELADLGWNAATREADAARPGSQLAKQHGSETSCVEKTTGRRKSSTLGQDRLLPPTAKCNGLNQYEIFDRDRRQPMALSKF